LIQKNIQDAKKIKYKLGEAKAHNALALIYGLSGDYKKSIQSDLQAIRIFEELKDYSKIASTYADMGYAIRHVDYDQSVYHFRKAIYIAEKYKTGSNLSAIYNNYGEVIKEKNLDSAIYFFKRSLAICKQYKDTLGIPFSLNKLAESMAKKRRFQEAFRYLDESDSYRFKTTDTFGIADNIAYRADIYYEIPQIDSAIFYYEKSYVLALKTKFNSLERFCSKRLAELYKRKKNFEKAFFYLSTNKKLEDEALNAEVKNEISNLQIQYDTELKQRKIAEQEAKLSNQRKLNAENSLKLEARKRWMLISFLVAFLIFASALWFYRVQKQRMEARKREFELNKQLETAVLEKTFAEEKIRISRELHDNIGSHLTFLISSLDNLPYTKDADKRLQKVAELSNFGRLTMKDLRDTIWAMNHDGGTMESLIARISELRKVLPSTVELQIENKLNVDIILNGLQMLNMYRIVQEAIQNSLKYADATLISIAFSAKEDTILMSITDNGKGFDASSENVGNGLANMKRRSEDIFGTFEIKSTPAGTAIQCGFKL
jgi:signal transduction histidine kinase